MAAYLEIEPFDKINERKEHREEARFERRPAPRAQFPWELQDKQRQEESDLETEVDSGGAGSINHDQWEEIEFDEESEWSEEWSEIEEAVLPEVEEFWKASEAFSFEDWEDAGKLDGLGLEVLFEEPFEESAVDEVVEVFRDEQLGLSSDLALYDEIQSL
ncbi:hypothetical protein KFL_015550010, partial [Klebsormidium nitens]